MTPSCADLEGLKRGFGHGAHQHLNPRCLPPVAACALTVPGPCYCRSLCSRNIKNPNSFHGFDKEKAGMQTLATYYNISFL